MSPFNPLLPLQLAKDVSIPSTPLTYNLAVVEAFSMKPTRALLILLFISLSFEAVRAENCDRLPAHSRAYAAIITKDLKCLRQSVTTAADANAIYNGSPIAFATMRSFGQGESDPLLHYLLETGLNPNLREKEYTLLGYAILTRREAAFEMLINAGADVNLSYGNSSQEMWPLGAATLYGSYRNVTRLLEAGADTNYIPAGESQTLMSFAIGKARLNILRALLEAGADVEDRNKKGVLKDSWPLIRTATEGNIEIGRLLIEHYADVNRQTEFWGSTALHAAIRRDHPAFVTLLIEAGADINLKDRKGRSPLQVARKRNLEHLFSN